MHILVSGASWVTEVLHILRACRAESTQGRRTVALEQHVRLDPRPYMSL